MGKSLYVQRLAEQLKKISAAKPVHVIIPLHGPVVTADTVLNFFLDHYSDPSCCIYHLDIAPNVCYILYYCTTGRAIWGNIQFEAGSISPSAARDNTEAEN